jgi:1-deoxy-D-xylulose-5-phosphate reductoisomerase
MRIPIAHALAWPERMETPRDKLDLPRIGTLSFEAPDASVSGVAVARDGLEDGRCRANRAQCRQRAGGGRLPRRRIGFLDIVRPSRKALLDERGAPRSIAEVIDIDRRREHWPKS